MNSREEEVNRVLKILKPAMEADGGGVELLSIEDNKIFVRFNGACLVCPSIGLTMKYGIGPALTKELTWVNEVVYFSDQKTYTYCRE